MSEIVTCNVNGRPYFGQTAKDMLSLANAAAATSDPAPVVTYTLDLPAGRYLNSNERLHHMAKAPITRAWRDAALTAIMAGDTLPRYDRAHIVVTFTFADKRRRDVGNLYPTVKALVDGLVDAGVIPDDDDAHLLGPDLRRGYGEPGVRIDITELAA